MDIGITGIPIDDIAGAGHGGYSGAELGRSRSADRGLRPGGRSEAIGALTRLTRLNVSENRLTALPEAIGNLTQLDVLVVSRNRLTAVPEAIGDLGRLTSLDLGRNPARSSRTPSGLLGRPAPPPLSSPPVPLWGVAAHMRLLEVNLDQKQSYTCLLWACSA